MIFGLSTTAIGHRPLTDALDIYSKLQPVLSLNYLELAIGTCNEITAEYPNSLVLHDACLYANRCNLHYVLSRIESFQPYKEFAVQHKVRQMHIHAPLISKCLSLRELEYNLAQVQDYLELELLVEVMPSPKYYASCLESLPNWPLLLDISHINIWARGNWEQAYDTSSRLLPRAKAIHLSHNDGYRDLHDLIPENHWSFKLLNNFGGNVTYESLPKSQRKYERKDSARFNYLTPKV